MSASIRSRPRGSAAAEVAVTGASDNVRLVSEGVPEDKIVEPAGSVPDERERGLATAGGQE